MIRALQIFAQYLPALGNLNCTEFLANFATFLGLLEMGGGEREMTTENWRGQRQGDMGKLKA